MDESIKTGFLTADSSFVTGMGNVINLGGAYYEYNQSQSSEEADARALTSDWRIIGDDIRQVVMDKTEVLT